MEELEILQNFTILYVEDEEETATIVCDILKTAFKEVFYAPDGKVGLEVYKEKKPDIVLSDIQMPVMNGIEMSKEIKKINFYQQIALFTAFNEVDYLKQSVNIGISKYILKPLEEDQFFDALVSMAKVLQGEIDRKRLDVLLRDQSKIASLGEMIGNIAHQWRQPLSVITMHASGLKLSYSLGKEIDEKAIDNCVDGIVNQAQYLSGTIDDFREFFMADTQQVKEYNLKDIFYKLEKLMKSSFENNFITLDIKINDDDIIVKLNENILIQALINILNNAKDAIIENIEQSASRYFFIEIKKLGNSATMSFKDSGGGIKENIQSKIFEPYFTTKHQSVGTGVGLYMTHQIVTKHLKGRIEVSNVEYEYNNMTLKGAEFIISIPLENNKIKGILDEK